MTVEEANNWAEQEFQEYFERNKVVEKDGGITLDVGHIKIMVNPGQENYITLKSIMKL